MATHRVIFEYELDADAPEDAAIVVRDMLKTGSPASIFIVDVAGGKVVVDTEDGNESVIRDDRKRIGPVVMRREGPTGVLTSPVLAEFYGHDRIDSKTDIEQVEDKWLRLHGFGPEAYYDWLAPDGTVSEPFAVITVQRKFEHEDIHPATHMALAAYAQASQY
jgi:hypothetical protein